MSRSCDYPIVCGVAKIQSWVNSVIVLMHVVLLLVVLSSCRWDPDRFDPNAPHGHRSLEFCPFGVPSRQKCPGYLFGYFEIAIFASILLSRFKIVPVEGQKVTPVHGLVTVPKEEIHVYLKQRKE